MRIVFCLDFYYPHIGGAELLFGKLAEGLAASGHEVHVITQKTGNSPALEIHNGVSIRRISCLKSRYLFCLLCLGALLRQARKADIIHATTFASALPAWLVSKLTGKPMVLTVHEVWAGHWQQFSDANKISNYLNSIIERFIYLFDYKNYIAVSQSTARTLQSVKVPSDRISVIYNGIDYNFWKFDESKRNDMREKLGLSSRHVFFFSGRPGRSKGFMELLKAFQALCAQNQSAHLLAIVSDNAAVAKARKAACDFIKSANLENRITLLRPVAYSELPSYVSCADTVIVPSFSEGFGYTAAEACAMERPVIVTDNASLPEVVSGSVIFIPPRDSNALKSAMEQAMSGGYQDIPRKEFHDSANILSHIQLYNKIIKGVNI